MTISSTSAMRRESVTGIDAIAGFARTMQRPVLGQPVRDMAKKCLVDWFAVSLAGRSDAAPTAARQHMQRWATAGRAMNLYGDTGAAAPMALVNGTLSHSLDFDDMHFGSAVHASGPTLAAALAVAMDRGCDEEDMLAAFVAGYEVATMMGQGGTGPRLAAAGWHPTGVLGHFSATVAAAVLLRLPATQVAHALGLAATQAAGLQASGGTGAKPFHVGKSAMNGIMAAELASLGMDAATTLLDDARRGILGCLFQQAQGTRFDALGQVWQIEGNTFKPWAACQLTHAPHEAARNLHGRFRRAGLRAIRIHVNPLAKSVAGRLQAGSPMEGKFSMCFCVALGLMGYEADIDAFTDERIGDPELQALTELGRIHTSEQIERWAARVELEYADGSIVRGETMAVRGSPTRPLEWEDLDRKFIGAVSPVLGNDAPRLLELLHGFEQPGSLARLGGMLAAARQN